MLRREVAERLRKNHSPGQIAARLREDFPGDPEMWVSHQTIYQSLYVEGRGALKWELTKQLRTRRAVRKPERRPDRRRERVLGMVNISERPPAVEDRAVPGDWKGGLVMGRSSPTPRSEPWWSGPPGSRCCCTCPRGGTARLAVQEAMVAKMSELPQNCHMLTTCRLPTAG